jgi:hypothetical protein
MTCNLNDNIIGEDLGFHVNKYLDMRRDLFDENDEYHHDVHPNIVKIITYTDNSIFGDSDILPFDL